MRRLLVVSVVLLSGCASFNWGTTIAGGQCGKVDYCLTALGQSVCLNGERSGCPTVEEDENSTGN